MVELLDDTFKNVVYTQNFVTNKLYINFSKDNKQHKKQVYLDNNGIYYFEYGKRIIVVKHNRKVKGK